jgi:hypothetical protein
VAPEAEAEGVQQASDHELGAVSRDLTAAACVRSPPMSVVACVRQVRHQSRKGLPHGHAASDCRSWPPRFGPTCQMFVPVTLTRLRAQRRI